MPSVITVPDDFAMPAGLRLIASASSAEATPAPARLVDTTPAPGKNRPPAAAGSAASGPETHNPNANGRLRFMRPRTYLTALAMEKPDMRHQDSNRRRGHAADARGLPQRARSDRHELLDHLARQPRDHRDVELVGNAHVVGALHARGVALLAA